MNRIVFLVIALLTGVVYADENQLLDKKGGPAPVERHAVQQKVNVTVTPPHHSDNQLRTNKSIHPLYKSPHLPTPETVQSNSPTRDKVTSRYHARNGGTSIKKNFSAMKFVFPFTGVRGIDAGDIVGYEGVGSYINEEEQEGWNGVRVFFNSSMGMCSYTYMETEVEQTPPDAAQSLVNGKPTSQNLAGDATSKYSYTLKWYTEDSISTLQCESAADDQEIWQEMIGMANVMDNR